MAVGNRNARGIFSEPSDVDSSSQSMSDVAAGEPIVDDSSPTRRISHKIAVGKSLALPNPDLIHSVRLGTPSLMDQEEVHNHSVARLSMASSVLSMHLEAGAKLNN